MTKATPKIHRQRILNDVQNLTLMELVNVLDAEFVPMSTQAKVYQVINNNFKKLKKSI